MITAEKIKRQLKKLPHYYLTTIHTFIDIVPPNMFFDNTNTNVMVHNLWNEHCLLTSPVICLFIVVSVDCFRRLLKTYLFAFTSASSALGVLSDYALYKSTHSLTQRRNATIRGPRHFLRSGPLPSDLK